MILDFSKCKTKEDVDKVFKKHSKQLNTIKDLSKLIIEAGILRNNKGIIKSKLTNKENQ